MFLEFTFHALMHIVLNLGFKGIASLLAKVVAQSIGCIVDRIRY